MDLRDKTAIVTDAASGIGAAGARAFAKAGAKAVPAARNPCESAIVKTALKGAAKLRADRPRKQANALHDGAWRQPRDAPPPTISESVFNLSPAQIHNHIAKRQRMQSWAKATLVTAAARGAPSP